MKHVIVVALLCLSSFFSSFCFASQQDEAVALVKSAAAYYKTQGMEKALEEFTNPKGQFNKGSIYVFVYSTDATMLAHPNASLVGQNMMEMPDADGKKFRKEIINKATKDGNGWVDYKYQNPKSKNIEQKTTYFEKVDDVVICCGVYKDK